MTRTEAIKMLVNATYSDEWQGNEELTKANHIAIKSLEAWDEVLNTLLKVADSFQTEAECYENDYKYVEARNTRRIIELIEQKLKEVEE